MLAVGMVSYGLASASRKVGLFGYVNLVLGLAVIALVRPHMAGILAITCAFPYILDKNRTGLWGGLLKLAVAPFLIAVCLYFVQQGADLRRTQNNPGSAPLNAEIAAMSLQAAVTEAERQAHRRDRPAGASGQGMGAAGLSCLRSGLRQSSLADAPL